MAVARECLVCLDVTVAPKPVWPGIFDLRVSLRHHGGGAISDSRAARGHARAGIATAVVRGPPARFADAAGTPFSVQYAERDYHAGGTGAARSGDRDAGASERDP